MPIETPAPGIYNDIPFEEYLAWDAVSNSSLMRAERSMHHFRHGRGWDEATPAMRLGSLIHCGKLEPLRIVERYVVMPPFEKTVRRPDGGEYTNPRGSAAYKAEVADFERQNAGRNIVLQAEYDRLLGAVTALHNNDAARRALEGDGPTEVSMVWIDPDTGVRCKARIDKLNLSLGLIADLKSTDDASAFEWHMKKRRYHRQAAMYQDGAAVVLGTKLPFWFVVVETTDPYMVRAAPVSGTALLQGRLNYKSLLQQIAECQQSGAWPGYANPDLWELPGGSSEPAPTVDESGEVTRF